MPFKRGANKNQIIFPLRIWTDLSPKTVRASGRRILGKSRPVAKLLSHVAIRGKPHHMTR